MSPSLSTSPNAAPRLTSESSKTAPASPLTSAKRPLPRLRNNWFRWCRGNGSFARASASTVRISPFATSRSSQPSLSKSNHPVPNPV